MPKTRLVQMPHQASYADPVVLRRGEAVHTDDREDIWDGFRWLWVIAADGRQGWLPDDLLTPSGAGLVAKTDYSAVELTCQAYEVLQGFHATHGWIWCRNAQGAEGWVPLRNLVPDSA